jgi:predicted negative regulator of RcsB-dependent stress response
MVDSASPWLKYIVGPLLVTACAGGLANCWQKNKAEKELDAQMTRDGMQYVKDALDPKLTPDDRKRVYDYLVLAFAHQSAMQLWAKRGLDAANRDVAKYDNYINGLEGGLNGAYDKIDELKKKLDARVDAEKTKCGPESENLFNASQQLLATTQTVASIKDRLEPDDPVKVNAQALGLERAGRLQDATNEFDRACKLGYATACFNLAMRLHRGGAATPESKKRAAELYDLSCAQNLASACTTGGDLMVAQGDEKKAKEMYAKGCKSGDKRGCSEFEKHSQARKDPSSP